MQRNDEAEPLYRKVTDIDNNLASGWSSKQILTLITVMSAQFCILTSYSLLAPFFPQSAAEKGMDNVTIGFLFATYQLVMFIMTPVYGLTGSVRRFMERDPHDFVNGYVLCTKYASNHAGIVYCYSIMIVTIGPKILCVSGCFLCGSSTVLFGLLHFTDPPFFTVMCFIARVAEGNGAAMFVVASMTALIKTLPSSASNTIGLLEMVSGFGYVVGPVVGAGLYTLGGYPAPFVSVGGMAIILSAILFFLLPKLETTEKQTSNFLRLFRIPGVMILFLHCCVTCISYTFLEPTLGPFLMTMFGSSTSTIGLAFGAWSAAYALSSPLFGKLADKGYLYSPVIISMFGVVVCELLIPPSPLLYSILPLNPSFILCVLSITAFGVFLAGIYIAPFQAVLNLLQLDGYSEDVHTLGLVSGCINSAYSLGSFIGPILSGYLTQRYGFPWATTVMSSLTLSMCLVLVGYVMVMKVTGRPLHPVEVPVN